jgi:hypothetical protein
MSARGVSSESESESDESEAGLAALTADFFAGGSVPAARAASISAFVRRWRLAFSGVFAAAAAGDVAATV